jgi:hypothetical protein
MLVSVNGKDIGYSVETAINLDNFDPAMHFKYYVSHQEYQDDTIYQYDDQTEHLIKYIICDHYHHKDGQQIGPKNKNKKIFVLREKIWKPTKEERKMYEAHCQCSICRLSASSSFSFSSSGASNTTTCPCCCGCIKAIDDVNVIGRTREYLENKALISESST